MNKLGRLYQNWAQDILASTRPDTALHYAQLAATITAQ